MNYHSYREHLARARIENKAKSIYCSKKNLHFPNFILNLKTENLPNKK